MLNIRSVYRAAIVTAVAVASSTSAQAQTSFISCLNGAQETPAPVSTPAFGNGTVLLNAERNQITINLSFRGLLTPILSAHIHNGAFGIGGPVMLDIFSLIETSDGGRAGSIVDKRLDVTAAQAAVLLAGNGYFNVHSERFRGGEIRGQINVVPEPSTYLLMATGLGGLALIARRKRAR